MKKIMFNDRFALTEAVLEGRKTMTRRILDYEKYKKTWDDMCRLGTPCFDSFDDFLIKRKAQYKIGEVVAVAQPYKVLDYGFHGFATNPSRSCGIRKEYAEKQKGWLNKMFVRADLMPHQIKITNIKVERLQDISDEDCMCEGVTWDYNDFPINTSKSYYINNYESFPSPRLAFAALVNRIKGKSTWEINPYVFTYTFELVK